MNSSFSYPLHTPLDVEIMEKRIVDLNPKLRAIRDWRTLDRGKSLHVLVKNNIGLEGFSTSAGSKFFKDLKTKDAFCVSQLKLHGVDVFGTSHMTELAGFVTTQNPNCGYSFLGGFPVNPCNISLPPGGSSTGSAIAVRAGFCDAALGTETRGSVIKPALACGVFAFKPSRGKISREGIVPLSNFLDSLGFFARNFQTLQLLLSMMCVVDKNDPLTLDLYSRQPKPSKQKKESRHQTIGILLPKNEKLPKQKLLTIENYLKIRGWHVVPILVETVDFCYKEISSLDFLHSMTNFIKRHQSQLTFRSAFELIELYRLHEDSHPYGMDRLEDALKFTPLSATALNNLVKNNISKAKCVIDKLCLDNECDFLCSPSIIDYWSISGAPSAVIPLDVTDKNSEVNLMIGTRYGEDQALINLIESLASHQP